MSCDHENSDAVLYILMRNDLASMNPGKAVAQGAHAANLAIRHMERWGEEGGCDECPFEFIGEWEEQGGGFGTTIVLGVDGAQLQEVVTIATEVMGLCAGVTHDPTYPLRDGEVTHLIPLDTCGYVFTRKRYLDDLLSDLSLMR